MKIAPCLFWFLAFLPSGLLAQENAFPPSPPGDQGIRDEALLELGAWIQEQVDQRHIVGAEFLVIKNRRTVFHQGYGWRNREAGLAMEPGSVFNVRSMTKPLTGTLMHQLFREKGLSLSLPVAEFLPSFAEGESAKITVEQLAQHRSGLPLTMLTTLQEVDNLQEIAEKAGKSGPTLEPGSEFQYSDTGSDTLGAVLEVVAEKSLDRLFQERILDPLGMQSSSPLLTEDQLDQWPLCSLYGGLSANWEPFWQPSDGKPFYPFTMGSQSLYCTLENYARFLAAWIDEGVWKDQRWIAKEAVAQATQPFSTAAKLPTSIPDLEVKYGHMWLLYQDQEGETVILSHSGSDGTWAWAWPQQDLIVCFFTQSRGQGTGIDLEAKIDRLLARPDSYGEEIALAKELRPCLGTYLANFGRFRNTEFHVVEQNGQLAVQLPQQITSLLQPTEEEGLFALKIDSRVKIGFLKTESGLVEAMQLHQGDQSFTLPRGKAAAERKITEQEVADFLGFYHDPEAGQDVEMVLFKDQLAVKVPNMPAPLAFHPPDEENRWALKVNASVSIRFQRDQAGRVTGYRVFSPDGKEYWRPRVVQKEEAETSTETETIEEPPSFQDPELQARLTALSEQLEKQRQEYRIPGMALAIVYQGRPIWVQGFGVSDVEAQTPVTPRTVFAIGSVGKSFTSLLMTSLAQEGQLDLDAPVTQFIPYFDLNIQSEDPKAEVTLRDLLCHRTGFTRMGVLWKNLQIPHEKILKTAAGATPYAPFRKRFLYNNVMYLAAGVAAEAATGKSWAHHIETRFLKPLQMKDSSVLQPKTEARREGRFHDGYHWNEFKQSYRSLPLVDLSSIAPAGGIYSTAADMAHYIQALLDDGRFGNRKVFEKEALEACWSPHTPVGGGVSYGLGWMLGEWQGQPEWQHGGNIDGFAAQVALLPEQDLGLVLLANMTSTPLTKEVLPLVWNAVLGSKESSSDVNYQPYLGSYKANFGQFQDATFTVKAHNGKLALDVPGQQLFQLQDPDEQGFWNFAATDQIRVVFERDAQDQVVMLKLHQSGYIFELPREGFSPPPPSGYPALQDLLGQYRCQELDQNVELLQRDGALIFLRSGGNPAILLPPNPQGHWVLKIRRDRFLTFASSLQGEIDAFIYHQPGAEYRYEKIAGSTPKPLPDLELLLSKRADQLSTQALANLGIVALTGRLDMPHSGIRGTMSFLFQGKERLEVYRDFGDFGWSRGVMDGNFGFHEGTASSYEELTGRSLKQMQESHPMIWLGDLREAFAEIEILRREQVQGRTTVLLKAGNPGLPPHRLWLDEETGDILRESYPRVSDEGMPDFPMDFYYSDYQTRQGLRLPTTIRFSQTATGTVTMTVEKVEIGVDPDTVSWQPRLKNR
ncbi:MAG: hypothetical protein DWQ01_20375 [Planctomycetota bacterium]|nr:MAG: hypothetical protein DWQ01_20375 [Planctomycetota bacterium]